ncbi:MAG: class I SAM-dependent methyltransferase [Terriglobales bacterium]
MPLNAISEQLQRHERMCREQVLSYPATRRMRYEWQVEAEAVMARLHPRPGLKVLDAGCGIGRLSLTALRSGAHVTSLDFALRRLQYLRRHAPSSAAPQLCQADLTRLPLRTRSWDAVVCTQVLEHIPQAVERRKLLASFARLLRPGGRLLLTVYNFSLAWQRRGQPSQGTHASGIFYHCYEPDELRAELEDFELLELCGLIHRLPRTYRLWPLLGPLGRHLDHRLERQPARSQRHGQLLLAHARIR